MNLTLIQYIALLLLHRYNLQLGYTFTKKSNITRNLIYWNHHIKLN